MIVGVHSDESYVNLKHKHTIDNTEKRMSNVKKYADQVSLAVCLYIAILLVSVNKAVTVP